MYGDDRSLGGLAELLELRNLLEGPLSADPDLDQGQAQARHKPVNQDADQREVSEEPTYDEYGLPSNIHDRFSRWFYGDMSDLPPGGIVEKKLDDEVKPPFVANETVVTYCNEVDTDNNFKFITQDIDLDDVPAEEVLLTPTLRLQPSSNLRESRNQARAPANSMSGEPTSKKKSRLTFRVKWYRTIIDRTAMLKRIKSRPKFESNHRNSDGQFEPVSSTSLIAPGEDCDDDSDECEIIEIDCDL